MNQQERDQFFASVWRECGGVPKLVYEKLGISKAKVAERRRNVERRLGIHLPTADMQGRARYNTAAVLTKQNEGAVLRRTVLNGVVLIGSDAHIWPGPLSTMQRAFIAACGWFDDLRGVVLNGDVFDGATISRHPSIGWEKRPTVQEELQAARQFTDRVVKATPNVEFRDWPAGNHDLRFESRLAMLAPEYRGVAGIHLKDHFPGWTPCWRLDVNDDLVIRHREYGGEHADWTNVVRGGKSIVTGHDHRTGVVLYRDYRGIRYGVRSGFLGDSPLDPQYIHYLEAREPNWHPAFVVLTFRRGILLPPELVTKHNDKSVVFRGQVLKV